MNEFKKAISEAQAEKAKADHNKDQLAAAHEERLRQWLADVRSWEQAVYYPAFKDADEALTDIGGRAQSLNTQEGTYNLTVQAKGKAQRMIFKIERDGTLNIVTQAGLGVSPLGNIAEPSTSRRFKDALLEMVKSVAS